MEKKQTMMKFGSEAPARDEARNRGVCYGWSVFAPGWFVGTEAQLRAIGVVRPKR